MTINKDHLSTKTIQSKIVNLYNKKWVKYLIFDNFIDKNFYTDCLKELNSNNIEILDVTNREYSNNKSVFIKWEKLSLLDKFLSSKPFEKYLSIFLKNNVKREFYIDKKWDMIYWLNYSSTIWKGRLLFSACWLK